MRIDCAGLLFVDEGEESTQLVFNFRLECCSGDVVGELLEAHLGIHNFRVTSQVIPHHGFGDGDLQILEQKGEHSEGQWVKVKILLAVLELDPGLFENFLGQ